MQSKRGITVLGFSLLLLLALTGCMAVTEHYQKAVYGHALEPGMPCKKGDVWKNWNVTPGPPRPQRRAPDR